MPGGRPLIAFIPQGRPSIAASATRRAWIAASLAPFLALALFRPWVRTPFPVWDYPSNLPIFERAPGIWNGAMALAEWNRADGRANYFSYFEFSITWALTHSDTLGWQIARALVMLAAAILLVQVARRLGATPLAAALGALVFSVAVPSTEGWLFLAGEQLATCFLLLMVLASAGYTTTPAWRSRAVLIAVLAASVMLTKEVIGLCLPLIVIFAVTWEPGVGFRGPRIGPRERWLALLLLFVIVAEAWSVRAAMQDAVAGSYASAFGRNGLDGGRVFTLFQAMLLPNRFSSAGLSTTLYPANLAFLLLLLLGLLWPAKAASGLRGMGWLGLGLLAYPLIGALTYALWPRYAAYYGIPFFAGSAGLIAAAATRVELNGGRPGRVAVAVLGLVILFYSGLVSARTIRQKEATAALTQDVTQALPRGPRLDTVFVVTPPGGGRRWPINAWELDKYARFLKVPASHIPVFIDASCDAVMARVRQPLGNSAVLNDQNPCGRLPVTTRTWARDVGYIDWISLRLVPDTMQVFLTAPSWGQP